MSNIAKRQNLWTRIYRSISTMITNPKQPEHGASYAASYGVTQPFSVQTSMSAYSGHAYTHACATRLSQDIAALPLKLLSGVGTNSEIIEEHPFYRLMDQPNTTSDGFLFREQLAIDLSLSGNCYILLVGSLSNLSSLFRLHPENIEIVTDQKKGIVSYKFTESGSSVMYPLDRVLHLRNASWRSGAGGDLYGTGAIESLVREINADINAQKLASDSSSQGRPDILLSPKDDSDIWGEKRRREIMEAYQQMSNKGGAMVMSGQVNIDPINLSPRDMEFTSARKMARENISAVMGVPSAILGLPDANYATARQANLTYWQIQMKKGRKFEILFSKIARLYSSDLRVELDYTSVEALQEVRNDQLTRINLHIANGLTPAEAYSYEGLKDSPFSIVSTNSDIVEDIEEEEKTIEPLSRFMDEINRIEAEKKSLKLVR